MKIQDKSKDQTGSQWLYLFSVMHFAVLAIGANLGCLLAL